MSANRPVRRGWLILLVVVVLVAAWVLARQSGSMRVHVSVLIIGREGEIEMLPAAPEPGRPANCGCQGIGKYADIAPGTPIRVVDGDLRVLARGRLGSGLLQVAGDLGSCLFGEMVTVPEADVYTLHVGERIGSTRRLREIRVTSDAGVRSLGMQLPEEGGASTPDTPTPAAWRGCVTGGPGSALGAEVDA